MLSSDWETGATVVVPPFEQGECGGEFCSQFSDWETRIIQQLGDHTTRNAALAKAEKCAKVAGCIFEIQESNVQLPTSATERSQNA